MFWTLVFLVACGSDPTVTTPESVLEQVVSLRSDLSLDDFAKVYGESTLLIDVRTPEEFKNGRVPGARLVPMTELTPSHPAIVSHPKAEPIYLICHSGGRSARAADTLATAGFRTVNVLGGTAAWVKSGREVER